MYIHVSAWTQELKLLQEYGEEAVYLGGLPGESDAHILTLKAR